MLDVAVLLAVLTDARVGGDDVVALTPGGLLLRFSLPAVELEDVVYPDAPLVASIPSRPLAVGAYRASPAAAESIVVVTAREDSWQSEIHDLGTGRRWELDFLVSRLTIHGVIVSLGERGLVYVASE